MAKKIYTKEELLEMGIDPDELLDESIDALKIEDTSKNLLTKDKKAGDTLRPFEDASKALAFGALQGATFNFGDELLKSLGMSDKDLESLKEIAKQEQPITTVGELAGSFATPMPGVGMLGKALTPVIKNPAAREIVKSAIVGSAAGGLAAAGQGAEGDELQKSLEVGAAIGAGLPATTQFIGKAGGELLRAVKSPALLEAFGDIFSKAKQSAVQQDPIPFGSKEYAAKTSEKLIDTTQQFVEDLSKTASKAKQKKYGQFFEKAKAEGSTIDLSEILDFLNKSESKATAKFSEEFKDQLQKLDDKLVKQRQPDLSLNEEVKKLIDKANKKAVKFVEKEKDNLAKDSLREAQKIVAGIKKVEKTEDVINAMADNWLTLEQDKLYNRVRNVEGIDKIVEDLGVNNIDEQLRDYIGNSIKNTMTREIIQDPVTGKSKLLVSYISPSGDTVSRSFPFSEDLANKLKSPKDLLQYQKELAKDIYQENLAKYTQQADEALKKETKLTSPTILDVPVLEKEVVSRKGVPQRVMEFPQEIPKVPSQITPEAYTDIVNFLNDVANSPVRDMPEKRLAGELRSKLKDAIKSASSEEARKLFEEAEQFRKVVGQKNPLTGEVKGDFSRVFGHSLDVDEIASKGVDKTGKVVSAADKLRRDSLNKMYNPAHDIHTNLKKLEEYIGDLEKYGGPEFSKFKEDLGKIKETLKERDLVKLLYTGGSELERSLSTNILTDPLAAVKRLSAMGVRSVGEVAGNVERAYKTTGAKAVIDQILANPDALNAITKKLEAEGRGNTAKFLLNMAKKYQEARANTPLGVKTMSQKASEFIVNQSPGLQDTLLDIED